VSFSNRIVGFWPYVLLIISLNLLWSTIPSKRRFTVALWGGDATQQRGCVPELRSLYSAPIGHAAENGATSRSSYHGHNSITLSVSFLWTRVRIQTSAVFSGLEFHRMRMQ